MSTADKNSPWKLWAVLLAIIFTFETALMFLLPYLVSEPASVLGMFADSVLLACLSAPFLWLFVVRPLRKSWRAEANLSSAVLSSIVESVVICSRDGYIEAVNPAANRMFGYRSEEIIGQHLHRIIPGVSSQGGLAECCHLEATGCPKDGVCVPIEMTVSSLELGGRRSFLVAVHDVSDVKKQKEFLENLLENCAVPTFVIDPERRVLIWNRACTELTGYAPARILGSTKPCQAFYPEEQLLLADYVIAGMTEPVGEHYHVWEKSRFIPEGLYAERFCRNLNGRDRFLAINAAPVRNSRGELLAVIETLEDISERKQAEAEVREREETLQTLLESASEAIVIVAENGAMEMVNARAVSMFGYPREKLLGQPVELLLPPELAEKHAREVRNFFREPKNRPMGTDLDLVLRHESGEVFPVDISLSYVRRQSGLVCMVSITDISERRRAAQELTEARDRALDASRLKSEFLATMSHEIRTPINCIIGITDLLLESELADEQHQFAQMVADAGTTLLDLINDVLDTSKIESGKMELERVPFDLAATIQSIISILAIRAAKKNLVLDVTLDPDLPQRLFGDPIRIRQVLLNLLSNAIKFTEQGSVCLEVAVQEQRDGAVTLRIAITDTGIGMSGDVTERLFQPFMQADGSTTRKFGGTGLGLAICKNLVTLMEGEISVSSQPGTGSTFWVVLSLGVVTDAAPAVGQTARCAPVPNQTRNRIGRESVRILLVEDNDVNSMVALRMLERLGYRADRVANGREAVDAVASASYHLVLMDCQMPELDGFAASREIRRREMETGGRVVIVALTANAMSEDRERCLDAGMDDYLTKPVDRRELATVLERWLRHV